MGLKIPPKVKELTKKLFTKEKMPLILLFGVLIAVISIPIKKNDEETKEETGVYTNYKEDESYIEQLEKRLEGILENTDGVGKTEVMITVKNNGKEILYTQTDSRNSKTTENTANGGSLIQEECEESESVLYTEEDGINRPYVQQEEMPEIQGVVIIAQGAGNAKVTTQITEAASTLLGIPINKIKVLKMEV